MYTKTRKPASGKMIRVDKSTAEAAVLGGAFLGGGGGGDWRDGLKYANIALELGDVFIADVEELNSDDYVATASIIGAPAAKEKYVLPSHIIKSFQLLVDVAGIELAGLITSENGGLSTVNGWIPAAVYDVPIIDAPANGRAHPMGIMGSLGLHKLKDYTSIQSAVGGDRKTGRYVEVVVRGSIEKTDRIIRIASVEAGGMIAVTRNPVTIDYLRQNAAIKALSKAIEIGKIFQKYSRDPEKIVEEIVMMLNGRIVDEGVVEYVSLETRGGYDIGKVIVRGRLSLYEITFWNEYMTLEDSGNRRIATFPDLIVTLDSDSSLPISSAEIKKNDRVMVLSIPRENIILGTGVKDPEILSQVENVINKKILL